MLDLVPEEELTSRFSLNLTPLVDFLFLVIAVFSILAVTRTGKFDSEISLVQIEETDLPYPDTQDSSIHLSVTQSGNYKWITEFNEYLMKDENSIVQELEEQKKLGLIPRESKKTEIILQPDSEARWDSVFRLVHALKTHGYSVHPAFSSAPRERD